LTALLNESRRSNDRGKVVRAFLRLLEAASTEEELQRFLQDHPFILFRAVGRGVGFLVVPKFRFGSQYVSDFLLGVWAQNWEFTLVELEPKNASLFTNDGTPSRQFSTAVRQLADWNLWIAENRNYFIDRVSRHVESYLEFIATLLPEEERPILGLMREVRYFSINNLVVMGRRRGELHLRYYTEEQRRRLAIAGLQCENMRVVSYDWLVDLARPALREATCHPCHL
jgi:Domain of unknown function (DUF4263)/BTB/POZ domain